MIRKGLTVSYTPEDEIGFNFKEMTDEQKFEFLEHYYKRIKRYLIILTVLLLPTIPFFLSEPSESKLFLPVLYVMVVMFVVVLNLLICFSGIRQTKKQVGQVIEIEILEKLPIETERAVSSGTRSNYFFYPVRGRDTTTSYESVVYVSEDQYYQETANVVRWRKRC